MKLRKVASVAMATILATASLVACGGEDKESASKDEKKVSSFSEAVEEGMKLEDVEFTSDLKLVIKGTFDEEVSQIIGGNELEMSFGLDGKKKDDDIQATVSVDVMNAKADIMDVIKVDDTTYFGIATMMDGLTKLVKDIAGVDISEYLASAPEGDYLALSKQQMEEIFGEAIEDMTASYEDMLASAGNMELSKEQTEAVNDLVEIVGEVLEDACSKDGDSFVFKIGSSNINDIVNSFATVAKEKSEEICKAVNTIAGEEVIDKATLEQVVAMLGVYDVESILKETGVEFDFSVNTSFADNKWNMGASVSMSDGTDKIAVSFDYTAKESDDIEIKAPTSIVDEKTTQSIIDELKKSMELSYNLDDMTQSAVQGMYDEDDYNDVFDAEDSDMDDMDDADESEDIVSEELAGTYSSIKEFIESEEFQSQIESLDEYYDELGITLDVSVDDDGDVIYTFVYEDINLDEDESQLTELNESIEAELEGAEVVYEELADTLKEAFDEEYVSVVLVYADSQGNTIYTTEY